MHLMHEDLARAHMDARLKSARATRRGHHVARAARLTRRAERARERAALQLARGM